MQLGIGDDGYIFQNIMKSDKKVVVFIATKFFYVVQSNKLAYLTQISHV